MANSALDYRLNLRPSYHINKDTFIFDGNSQSAHIIARTLLVNDPHQKFALIPKQNTDFFGIHVPNEYAHEQFLLLSMDGQVLCGNSALDVISERLKLKEIYH